MTTSVHRRMAGRVDRRDIEVRGGATAEELAAVLAIVASVDRGEPADVPSRYDKWRAARITALRAATHHAERPAHR